MKKNIILLLIISFFIPNGFASELPGDLKSLLTNKFPGITFRVDNSFILNNEVFLPLVPEIPRLAGKTELIYLVPDENIKNLPKLLWFSNDWVFVRLLKKDDQNLTIVSLHELQEEYKKRFLKMEFPSDLVVPEKLVLSKEIATLATGLPVEIKDLQKAVSKKAEIQIIDDTAMGILYLTSPDTGKIVFLKLSDLSMIYYIQAKGAPWEIAYNKKNNLLFITDFAKDQIYELRPMENSIFRSFAVTSMSSPVGISISEDGSLVYILEGLANDFVVYKTIDNKPIIKTKLPPNPSSFSVLKNINLIAVTSPSTNRLLFLNADIFTHAYQVMIEGSPDKVISDPIHKVFYVANRNANNISIVDPVNKIVKSPIQVGETPTSFALHPSGKWLYIANGKSNSISVLDLETNSITDTISLPLETQFPGDIEITSDGKWLITTSETTNTISIIDLEQKTVSAKLDVGATTHAAYIVY